MMCQFEDNYQKINGEKWGIYLHIPFCRKKCLYCDFFSGGAKEADWQLYAVAIVNELKHRKEELIISSSAQVLSNPASELYTSPDTLYIGGGTPSLMPVEVMREMVADIKCIVSKTESWEEFTLEINPEDITEDNCKAWRACGVNRVSMGIQTLNDVELKTIGRTHDSATALSGLRMLKKHFDNVTIDLIFGLPNQTIESWRKTVDTVLKESPQHISAYSLMFEEGTAMTILRDQGRLSFPEEEECLAMWDFLTETLAQNGYKRYEISNYALPGYESIHNRRYWLGNPYIGLGVAAHSYDGNNIRRANPHNIRAYLSRFNDMQGEDVPFEDEPFYEEEKLTGKELLEEKVMLSMRMAEGLDLEDFRKNYSVEAYNRLLKAAERQIKVGNLVLQDNHLRLTRAGIMISDDIILELII